MAYLSLVYFHAPPLTVYQHSATDRHFNTVLLTDILTQYHMNCKYKRGHITLLGTNL